MLHRFSQSICAQTYAYIFVLNVCEIERRKGRLRKKMRKQFLSWSISERSEVR